MSEIQHEHSPTVFNELSMIVSARLNLQRLLVERVNGELSNDGWIRWTEENAETFAKVFEADVRGLVERFIVAKNSEDNDRGALMNELLDEIEVKMRVLKAH